MDENVASAAVGEDLDDDFDTQDNEQFVDVDRTQSAAARPATVGSPGAPRPPVSGAPYQAEGSQGGWREALGGCERYGYCLLPRFVGSSGVLQRASPINW